MRVVRMTLRANSYAKLRSTRLTYFVISSFARSCGTPWTQQGRADEPALPVGPWARRPVARSTDWSPLVGQLTACDTPRRHVVPERRSEAFRRPFEQVDSFKGTCVRRFILPLHQEDRAMFTPTNRSMTTTPAVRLRARRPRRRSSPSQAVPATRRSDGGSHAAEHPHGHQQP